jgi:circadian clock protein KaiC
LGIAELDYFLAGGLSRATSTLLMGTPGVGKTLLGLQFLLQGAQHGEPALLLSFQKSQAHLLRLTAPFDMGPHLVATLQPEGGLTLLYQMALKLQADVIAERLLASLERTGAQRLVIDDIDALAKALQRAGEAERLEEWLTALLIALQQRNVTTLMISEIPQYLEAAQDVPPAPLVVLADNVLLAQQVSFEGQLRRVLSVLKMRYSAFDTGGREFRIAAPAGLEVLAPDQNTLRLLASARDPVRGLPLTGQFPERHVPMGQEEQ